jgi:hypothetical protein
MIKKSWIRTVFAFSTLIIAEHAFPQLSDHELSISATPSADNNSGSPSTLNSPISQPQHPKNATLPRWGDYSNRVSRSNSKGKICYKECDKTVDGSECADDIRLSRNSESCSGAKKILDECREKCGGPSYLLHGESAYPMSIAPPAAIEGGAGLSGVRPSKSIEQPQIK